MPNDKSAQTLSDHCVVLDCAITSRACASSLASSELSVKASTVSCADTLQT